MLGRGSKKMVKILKYSLTLLLFLREARYLAAEVTVTWFC